VAETIMPLDRQLANRNFLQPTGFKFTLGKYPKVDFFSNTAFFIALLYFSSYLAVYGMEIIKYISDKENKND
jgi:hypothetical protein